MQRCVPSKGLSVPHRADLPDQVVAPNNSGMRVANCEGTRRVSEEPLSTAPVLALEADAPISLLLHQVHRPASTVLSVISAMLIASRSPSLMFIRTAAVSYAEQPGAARAPILGPVVVSWEACWWAHGFTHYCPSRWPGAYRRRLCFYPYRHRRAVQRGAQGRSRVRHGVALAPPHSSSSTRRPSTSPWWWDGCGSAAGRPRRTRVCPRGRPATFHCLASRASLLSRSPRPAP